MRMRGGGTRVSVVRWSLGVEVVSMRCHSEYRARPDMGKIQIGDEISATYQQQ